MIHQTIDKLSKSLASRSGRRSALSKMASLVAWTAAATTPAWGPTQVSAKSAPNRLKKSVNMCTSYCELAVPMNFLRPFGEREQLSLNPHGWFTGRLNKKIKWRKDFGDCMQACISFTASENYASIGRSPVFETLPGDDPSVPGPWCHREGADPTYVLGPVIQTDFCEGVADGTTCGSGFDLQELFGGDSFCYTKTCEDGECVPQFTQVGAICVPDSDPPGDGQLYVGLCDAAAQACVWSPVPEPCGF